jgi:hypothetical protein
MQQIVVFNAATVIGHTKIVSCQRAGNEKERKKEKRNGRTEQFNTHTLQKRQGGCIRIYCLYLWRVFVCAFREREKVMFLHRITPWLGKQGCSKTEALEQLQIVNKRRKPSPFTYITVYS